MRARNVHSRYKSSNCIADTHQYSAFANAASPGHTYCLLLLLQVLKAHYYPLLPPL